MDLCGSARHGFFQSGVVCLVNTPILTQLTFWSILFVWIITTKPVQYKALCDMWGLVFIFMQGCAKPHYSTDADRKFLFYYKLYQYDDWYHRLRISRKQEKCGVARFWPMITILRNREFKQSRLQSISMWWLEFGIIWISMKRRWHPMRLETRVPCFSQRGLLFFPNILGLLATYNKIVCSFNHIDCCLLLQITVPKLYNIITYAMESVERRWTHWDSR